MKCKIPFRRSAVHVLGLAILGLFWVQGYSTSLAETQVRIDNGTPARSQAPAASGDAFVPTSNVIDIMHKGGVLMWPLAVCSVICVAVVFERFISLRHDHVIPKAFVQRFVEQLRDQSLDRAAALELCQKNGSPIAKVFAAAIKKWGRTEMVIEQAVVDAGERAANKLRRYIRVFTALAVITPLLGLLGTVFGMIDAFNAVAATSAIGRPELLAKGISQALLNTAAGLVIAIPAQSFYYYFVSRVDRLIVDMDALCEDVVNAISAEALEERAAAGQGSKTRRATR